jgi:hypothetical protein
MAITMDVIDWYPCFIDVEASGFGPESYPVSVAWCDHTGEIRKALVRPEPSWTYWDPQAERVHGIDRQRLLDNGWSAADVAARLEEDLRGLLAFSDAPEFDSGWLGTLYRAIDRPMPFTLDHADDLLVGASLRGSEMLWQAQARLDRTKEELRATASGRHDAGYDVGFLVALWRRALGETVKMNHGIGPVPELTATGSFRRVKRDASTG